MVGRRRWWGLCKGGGAAEACRGGVLPLHPPCSPRREPLCRLLPLLLVRSLRFHPFPTLPPAPSAHRPLLPPASSQIPDWLVASLPEGARVGIDPTLHTIEAAEKLGRALAAAGSEMVPLSPNPVDAVWGAARPAPPGAPLRVHALEWAGRSVAEKLAEARAALAEEGAGALLVTMLGALRWLLCCCCCCGCAVCDAPASQPW